LFPSHYPHPSAPPPLRPRRASSRGGAGRHHGLHERSAGLIPMRSGHGQRPATQQQRVVTRKWRVVAGEWLRPLHYGVRGGGNRQILSRRWRRVALRSVWTSGQGTWNDRDQRVCIDSGASRQYLSPMHACLIHGDRSQQPDLPPSLSLSLSLRGERDRGNVIMAILYSKKHRSVAMYNAGHLLRRQTDEMGREYDDFALRLRMRSGRFFV